MFIENFYIALKKKLHVNAEVSCREEAKQQKQETTPERIKCENNKMTNKLKTLNT